MRPFPLWAVLAALLPAAVLAQSTSPAESGGPAAAAAPPRESRPSAEAARSGAAPDPLPSSDLRAAHVKVQLREVDERVEIVERAGRLVFVLRGRDGRVELVSPDRFAERVYREQSRLRWWNRLLNVTSAAGIAWVALGFLGQLLFTGRMLLQWVVSERQRRSVVPPAFWWMSLGGASMLLVYFVWRKDIVGVVGQMTGWLIYSRNLRLIYRRARRQS